MANTPAYPWEAVPTGAPAALATALQNAIPRLETLRLVLRAPEIGDFNAYASILTSERARFVGGPGSREDAWRDFTDMAAGWLLRGHGGWTVADKATGAVLGFVLVHMEYGDREPELGFLFTAVAEGRGFAYEASVAARDHALAEMTLDRLVSYITPGNIRSIALAERLGAGRDTEAEAAFGDAVEVWRHWPLADDDGGMEAYA